MPQPETSITDRISALELQINEIEEEIAQHTSLLHSLYQALGLDVPLKSSSSSRDGGKVENPVDTPSEAPPA